jgi:uncharacterized protein (TIGR00730 family)
MGSRDGSKPEYQQKTIELAHALASKDYEVVYGGGKDGLMGLLATEVMQKGGRVVGVSPKNLAEEEINEYQITRLIQVHSMDERKEALISLGDGFIALPGGFGTLEEFSQVISWNKINLIHKPIVLLNVDKFYDPLMGFLEQIVEYQFAEQRDMSFLFKADTIPEALDFLENYN